MKDYNLTNLIWKEGNQYVGLCLNLDISSFGSTYDSALENLNEAVELYLEDTEEVSITEVIDPSLVTHNKEATQNSVRYPNVQLKLLSYH